MGANASDAADDTNQSALHSASSLSSQATEEKGKNASYSSEPARQVVASEDSRKQESRRTQIADAYGGTESGLFVPESRGNKKDLMSEDENPPLCGKAFITTEGLEMIMEGDVCDLDTATLFTARFERGNLRGVMMRAISTLPSVKDNPGILLETKESFPIAYVGTKELAASKCEIFRADMTQFGTVEAVGRSLSAQVREGRGSRGRILASIFATTVGSCNVVAPDGSLLATVEPNNPALFHPLATEDEFIKPQEGPILGRVVKLAPDACTGFVAMSLLSAALLNII